MLPATTTIGVESAAAEATHHQFRALTGMSPLQCHKQLRLQAARQRMLTGGLDATTAAYEVGYESVSQFSREYSRFFGNPPMRDVKALRGGKASPNRRGLTRKAPALRPEGSERKNSSLLPMASDAFATATTTATSGLVCKFPVLF